jgi:hypothetical protein
MERELPAGLSDAQRSVLCDFFAGRISAGQLTQRLGIEAPASARHPSTEPSPEVQQVNPDGHRQRSVPIPNPLRHRLAIRRSAAPSASSRAATR